MRLLATLLAPVEGRLLWAGQPVAADPARYRAAIDYAGHLDAIKPALSPRETLSFWAALRGAATPAIEAALDRFGLGAARPIGRAAFCRPGSGGGWRWPGWSLPPPLSGCSTNRPPRSTATARPG